MLRSESIISDRIEILDVLYKSLQDSDHWYDRIRMQMTKANLFSKQVISNTSKICLTKARFWALNRRVDKPENPDKNCIILLNLHELNILSFCKCNFYSRWTHIRNDILGAIVLFFACTFSLIGKDHLSVGIAALTFTYAYKVSQMIINSSI